MTYGIRMMIWAGLTFAMMNVAVKLVPNIPSSEVVFFRALVSFVLSAVIVRKKKLNFLGNNRRVLLMRGLFGTTALMLYFYTLQEMKLGAAMTIHYLTPIFTALIAHFLLKERLRPIQLLFFAISFAGVVLLKREETNLLWLDVSAGVVAALFSGAAYNCIRKLKFTEDSNVIILYFPMVALPITFIYTLALPGWVWPSQHELGLLILIGILTQIAQYFLTRAYQSEVANKVAAVSNLGVVYALVIGYLFFDESFSVWSIVGMLMVVSGVVLNVKTKLQRKVN